MTFNPHGILSKKNDYDPDSFIIESVLNIEKEKNDARNWWSKYISTYFMEFQLQTKIMIDTIRKHYDINSIFEYGCNTGRNLYYIKKEFPHYQVFGIDVNEDAIKTGIQKFDLPIKVGDEESLLEIPDDSFDFVFTISVIDHTITQTRYALNWLEYLENT